MKIIFSALVMMLSLPVLAQQFPARVVVETVPERITIHVINPYGQTITCAGKFFGKTAQGLTRDFTFEETQIAGRAIGTSFLEAESSDPFIQGWANIKCWK